jgi:hypothetical protein
VWGGVAEVVDDFEVVGTRVVVVDVFGGGILEELVVLEDGLLEELVVLGDGLLEELVVLGDGLLEELVVLVVLDVVGTTTEVNVDTGLLDVVGTETLEEEDPPVQGSVDSRS